MIATTPTHPTSKPTSKPSVRASRWKAFMRFWRTPKGLLFLAFVPLVLVAIWSAGLTVVGPNLMSAMLVAALADLALVRWLRKEWIFPSGALLTGLIVAMVLSPLASPLVAAVTAAISVASKYVFRTPWSNIFNPAALGLVATYYLFGSAESWWGSLPDLPVWAVLIVVACGLFIVDRINKLPMVLTFLGVYFLLFTVSALLGDPAWVAEIFRAPDANAALFFAFFMLDDPPTSPTRYPDQIWFGLIAAVAGFSAFIAFGVEFYLVFGVLLANGWESLRRWDERVLSKAAR
jgi:Na+-translocating ferredoxin:NAD+ oxidoreductase RnfD subunit